MNPQMEARRVSKGGSRMDHPLHFSLANASGFQYETLSSMTDHLSPNMFVSLCVDLHSPFGHRYIAHRRDSWKRYSGRCSSMESNGHHDSSQPGRNGSDTTSKLVTQAISIWRNGGAPDALEFIKTHPRVADQKSLVLDLAYEEYCLRKEKGESV